MIITKMFSHFFELPVISYYFCERSHILARFLAFRAVCSAGRANMSTLIFFSALPKIFLSALEIILSAAGICDYFYPTLL